MIYIARFRGKTAKEIYRCGKGIFITGSINGPLSHAIVSVGSEMSTIGSVAEGTLGYIFDVGFVRWVYKAATRLTYNVLGLPGRVDLCQIGALEECWFGERVYIFNDNRLKNYVSRIFKSPKGIHYRRKNCFL